MAAVGWRHDEECYTYEKVDEIFRGDGRAGAIGISAPVRIGFPLS
jgi:hypothetical protein